MLPIIVQNKKMCTIWNTIYQQLNDGQELSFSSTDSLMDSDNDLEVSQYILNNVSSAVVPQILVLKVGDICLLMRFFI
jgi:hypothetical protein